MSQPERYPNFDWLRLFLALEVVLSHLNGHTFKFGLPIIIPQVPGFLAISGFLVLGSWNNSQGAKHFWTKRALRVLPAMLVSFLLVLLLFGRSGLKDVVLTYVTLGLQMPLARNAALWSLGCEEIMYGLLGVLAVLGSYRKPAWTIWILLVASAILLEYAKGVDIAVQRILVLPAAFWIGNLVYLNRDKVQPLAARYGWVFVMAVLGARLMEQLLWSTTWPSINDLGFTVLGLLVILTVVVAGIARKGGKGMPIDLSYGLYIYHWPILTYLREHQSLIGWDLWVATLTLTLAMSLASWYLIESRFLALKRRPATGAVPSSIA